LSIRADEQIRELVNRARRRFFFNVAVAQGVLAASVAMAGAVLILIFGNQFLDWRWLALIAGVTFPIAYFRTARRVPSAYRVAQIVDDRLALRDSLSTALYFGAPAGGRKISESMRQAQLEESERLSRQVDTKTAVPLTAPRALYAFGALFLAAMALFALRYGFERRMDLKKPLARILLDALGGGFEQRAALNKQRKSGKNPWDQQTPASPSIEDQDPEAQGKLDEAPPGVLDTIEVPDVNNEGAKEATGKGKGKGNNSEAEGERVGDPSEESESAQGAANSKDSDQAGSKQGENSAGKQGPNSTENSSLASKIKDAMSNLLASMRPQNSGANQQQPGQNGQQKSQQAKGDQKGAMGQGQKKGGEQSSDSQDGQSSDDADSGKTAEGKSSGKSSDEQASHNPGSGIGKQDGAKDAKLAEQLAAMGKISEIIGKRSANVTGEVTIEVNSSKQQLKTPYSDSKAAHGESGGEINRDEVPVAFQQYVQQYFEQVRKQAAPAKGGSKGPAPKEPAAAPSAPPTQ
jgi:hypothetical protein